MAQVYNKGDVGVAQEWHKSDAGVTLEWRSRAHPKLRTLDCSTARRRDSARPWTIVLGQLSLVNCPWSIVLCQLSLVNCPWSIVLGQLSLSDEERVDQSYVHNGRNDSLTCAKLSRSVDESGNGCFPLKSDSRPRI